MNRRLLPLAAFAATTLIAPARLCQWDASNWFHDDPHPPEQLADTVAAWVDADLQGADYATGSARFDGEWWWGTYIMAGLGFGQLGLHHPDQRDARLDQVSATLDHAIRPEVRDFDTVAWGHDALADLDCAPSTQACPDHAAARGYLNLLLGVERLLAGPDAPHADLHDDVTHALTASLMARPQGLLETYPGEGYPVDNAAVLASVGLHAVATGQPVPAWLDARVDQWARDFVEPDTGLLIQAVDHRDGRPLSPGRGSGTALASYFLGWTHPEVATDLAVACRDTLGDSVLGFHAVQEYAPGVAGRGDIDSGPLIGGFSISATGFSLSGARLIDDPTWHRQLLGTTRLFGAPLSGRDGSQFVTGGPLGNAILLAMLTSPRPDDVRPVWESS